MTVPFVTPHDLDPPHDDALDSHPEFLFLCYAFLYTGFWRPVASMCLGSVVLPAYACKIKDFIIINFTEEDNEEEVQPRRPGRPRHCKSFIPFDIELPVFHSCQDRDRQVFRLRFQFS